MSTVSAPQHEKRPFSTKRVLILLLPLAAILVSIAFYTHQVFQAEAHQQGKRLLDVLGLGKPTQHKLDSRFNDENADLVADVPTVASAFVDPDPGQFQTAKEPF